jgi:hypothetical protein
MRFAAKSARPVAGRAVALTRDEVKSGRVSAVAAAHTYDMRGARIKRSWLTGPLKLFSQELLALVAAAVTAFILLLIANVLLVATHLVFTLCALP